MSDITAKICELLAKKPQKFVNIYYSVMNDGPCEKIYKDFWNLSVKQRIQFDSGTCLYSLKPQEDSPNASTS